MDCGGRGLWEGQESTLRHVRGSVVDCWIDGPEYQGRHPIGHGKGLRVISLCLVFRIMVLDEIILEGAQAEKQRSLMPKTNRPRLISNIQKLGK